MRTKSIYRVLVATGLFFLLGCASRPYLIVDYKVSAASQQLVGQAVRLHVKDLRQDTAIFSPTAAAEFRGFKNLYSLTWIMTDNSQVPAGVYDLKDLFRKAFEKRLQQMGVNVTPDPRANAPLFEVVLKEFKIDLQDRKWIAQVSYEANLSRDSHLIARETVSGDAERLRVIGRKGADMVLSDIFSEILNRVNILKLFQQAKLV